MSLNSHARAHRVLNDGLRLGLAILGIAGSSAIAVAVYVRSRGRPGHELGPAHTEQGAPPADSASQAAGPSWIAKPIALVCPLPMLPDGRKPRITSHHKARNPSRPTHDGVDWFYPVLPSDPAWKRGDGEGTSNGKWIVPPRTPAIAVNAGRVQLASSSPTGWRVWLDHGPVRTGYFHLSELFVSEGQHVVTGQQLGIIGDNPRDKDARHLHFEVSTVERYAPMDPVPFLRGAAYLPLVETTGPIREIEALRHLA